MIIQWPVNTAARVYFDLNSQTTGLPITGAATQITAYIFSNTGSVTSGTVTEVAYGLYYCTFTPTASGFWGVKLQYPEATPVIHGASVFLVGNDVEGKIDTMDAIVDSIYGIASNGVYGNSALKTILDAVKGAGWSTETLKTIYDALAAAAANVVLVKAQTDKINELGLLDDEIKTFNLQSSTSEQTVLTITPTVMLDVSAIKIDVDSLTQAFTVKVYDTPDGSTYREVTAMRLTSVPASTPTIILRGFPIDSPLKITFTSAVAEGSARQLSIKVYVRSMTA